MDLTDRVIKTFAIVFNKNENEIGISDTKENIEAWDSLGHLHLIMNLEEVFNIRLNTEDVVIIDSVEKCIEILKKY